MRLTQIKTASALAGFAALGLTALPVAAQQSEPNTQEAPVAPQAASFTDEKLESFVLAAVEVAKVREQFQSEVGSIETPEAEQAAVQEANSKMEQSITDTPGITLDEYVEIGEAAQTDPALSEKLGSMLQARTQQ